jgi:hypothetical protein
MQGGGNIDSGGGFAYTAFLVDNSNDLAHKLPPN